MLEGAMELLEVVLAVILSVTSSLVFFGILFVVSRSLLSVAQNRSARWGVMMFVAVMLIAWPFLIREYVPYTAQAILDSYRETRGILRELQTEAVNDVMTDIEEAMGNVPAVTLAPAETPMPTWTPTPFTPAPTVAPADGVTMPALAPEVIEPAATPIPTWTPAPTPVPTLDLGIWNPMTPPPTPLIGGK